jgi:hypothetical protein
LRRRLTLNRLIAYTANLEAAIIFGDAVWDHLRAEFARVPKYDAWKEIRYEGLRKQPLFLFISEGGKQGQSKNKIALRQFLMHIGGNRLTLSVALDVLLTASGKLSVRMVVLRGQPWYRRSPRVLWDDAVRPIREWLSNLRQEFATRRSSPTPQEQRTANVEHTFYFDDPNRNTQPAREVVRQYLELMEREVDEVEKNFT